MNESQDNNNRMPGAGTAVASTSSTSPTERFERGIRMRELYERMRPDQRTAIAGEFIRLLTLAGDPHAEQFRQKLQDHTQITADAHSELLSAEQVEAIDGYVRQRHPKMIAQLLSHPVTQAALAMPGAPAEAERDTAESDAAESGPAYATSWDQTQQQGEEAAQRASEDEDEHKDEHADS